MHITITIITIDVFDHLNDLRLAMSEIKRVLKPEGLLVFDTINRTWTSYLIACLIAQGANTIIVITSDSIRHPFNINYYDIILLTLS